LGTDIPENLPEIYIDPERMAQVLGNLLSNALKYTPSVVEYWLPPEQVSQKRGTG
jgi:signal transduction histidine kinase